MFHPANNEPFSHCRRSAAHNFFVGCETLSVDSETLKNSLDSASREPVPEHGPEHG